MRARRTGLYIHIPFCHARCAFCAFYLEIHRDDAAERFLTAFEQELTLRVNAGFFHDPSHRVETIYLGGGTPTSLRPDQLVRLLAQIRQMTPLDANAEVTVEAHPDGLTPKMLTALREAGVTRLSLGAESLDQAELIRVGRPGQATSIMTAVTQARACGFTNINFDVMFGLPGQTAASWSATLDGLLALEPTHLSCYALTVEPGTALAHAIAQGFKPAPDPELQTTCELIAEQRLTHAGYERYELSNYAKPGWSCRHNRLHWEGDNYLGLGPSAESYVDGVRFGNVADLDRYVAMLATGRLPIAHEETLSLEAQRREAVVFGLRQLVGVPQALVDRAACDTDWHMRVERLLAEGLLETQDGRLRFTRRGRQLADSVADALV
ncbi:MAG: radical SAM family heme chaperone HemW [Nitrospiraceae bacterium]